jgi:Tol biopolymer transport system component
MGVRPSPDGRKLLAVGEQRRGELVRLERGTSDARAYMGGISAEMLSFSGDGQWIAYVSFPDGTLWRSRVNGEEKLQLTQPPASALMPRWSPDDRRILFFGTREPRERWWIFTVSRDGGALQAMVPEAAVGASISLADPTWSPDGRAVAFATAGRDGDQDIRIVDVPSGRIDVLPGSEGLFSPRWSPSGRYIAAMKRGAYLTVHDLETGRWNPLYDHDVDFPVWAPDSASVYFRRNATGKGQDSDVYRVWIADRRVERVWSAEGFVFEQSVGAPWLGLAPDGSLLSMRSTTMRAIYAFDWEAP